jgi:ATP phosphoribosyltransferase
MSRISLAIPSKGRLMEQAQGLLEKAGYGIDRTGQERGYRGRLTGAENVDVVFLSASDIAAALKAGEVDVGITGEDLLREAIAPGDAAADVVLRLAFGPANVVVAVPDCWLDVAQMSDLDDVARQYYSVHGRRLRVATKYMNLTRRYFAAKGVTGYRIVESLGATEGAPAAGSAELIVDITTSGATLKANGLKILDDGLMLSSCAVLAATGAVAKQSRVVELKQKLQQALLA